MVKMTVNVNYEIGESSAYLKIQSKDKIMYDGEIRLHDKLYYDANNNLCKGSETLVTLIDKFKVTDVECDDYLVNLFIQSYIGNTIELDEIIYTYKENRNRANKKTLMNGIGDLSRLIESSFVYNKDGYGICSEYLHDNPNGIKRFACTLLNNFEKNYDLFKEATKEEHEFRKYNNELKFPFIMQMMVLIAHNTNLIDDTKALYYLDMIIKMLDEDFYKELCEPEYALRKSFGIWYTEKFTLCKVQLHFNLQKYLVSNLISELVKLKSKCALRDIDSAIILLINLFTKDGDNYSRYYKKPEYVEKTKAESMIDNIDLTGIKDINAFVKLVVSKNKRRTSPALALHMGYLICPDLFDWSAFNEQIILDYLPDNPSKPKLDEDAIPLKDIVFIRDLAFTDYISVSRSFTFINLLPKEKMEEYIDAIAYNLAKGINISRYEYRYTLLQNIYNRNSFRSSSNKTEENIYNSENMKILFDAVVNYYEENCNKKQIQKLIELIDAIFPTDFVKMEGKKFKKVRMELTLKGGK